MKALVLGLFLAMSAATGWVVWARSAPALAALHPATGEVPANLLRLYLDFSEPMGGDDVFEHLRLLDASGRPVADAFRELELWSRNRTRLMVYIHPGRVKTGLAMGGEFGPVLEGGKTYTLELTPGMKSLRGRATGTGFRRELRVGPPLTSKPDLARWGLEASRSGLTLVCDRWMDQAGLEDWLRVEGVPGRWIVEGRRVTFLVAELFPGRYTLTANAEMEDVCGNSFQRTFETRPDASRPEDYPQSVSRDFQVP